MCMLGWPAGESMVGNSLEARGRVSDPWQYGRTWATLLDIPPQADDPGPPAIHYLSSTQMVPDLATKCLGTVLARIQNLYVR